MFYTDKTNTKLISTKRIVLIEKDDYAYKYKDGKEFYLHIYIGYNKYFTWKYADEKERDEEFDKLLELLNRKSSKNILNEIKL